MEKILKQVSATILLLLMSSIIIYLLYWILFKSGLVFFYLNWNEFFGQLSAYGLVVFSVWGWVTLMQKANHAINNEFKGHSEQSLVWTKVLLTVTSIILFFIMLILGGEYIRAL